MPKLQTTEAPTVRVSYADGISKQKTGLALIKQTSVHLFQKEVTASRLLWKLELRKGIN